MRSRTERRLGIASLVLTTLWAVMVFSPSFGGPGTRRDLPSAVKPDGEGAQAGSVERSLGSQSASEDFSILEMVLDSVSPTSAHRERFASPHEPPGRPPDRPPDAA